jgi:hypothetical protein
MTVKEYCNSCQNKGSHKCHSCCGKYYDGVLQGKPTKYRKKQQTNADRIRAMSDEELAKFMNLCGHDFPPYCDVESSVSGECDQNCIKCAEEWLKQPVEE